MDGPAYRVLLTLGDAVPADRLFALLEAVGRLGSLNRATAELGMSYRHAWGLVKRAEERLGVRLLDRHVGGAEGGGAELTPAARDLLTRYRQFRAGVERQIPILGGRGVAPAVGAPDRRDGPGAALPATGAPGPGAGVRGESGGRGEFRGRGPLLLASTIGPVETGLVPALAEAFLQETGIAVRAVAAGSGQALDLAREGRVDLVLSHAPREEADFVAAGYGTGRYPLMENDFVLVGPGDDPAGARGAGSVREALRAIARARVPFLSRGDASGTHLRERVLWEAAGVTPEPPWYEVYALGALGSRQTLAEAAARRAYTLVDRATVLTAAPEGMAVLVAGDPELRNVFALVPVSPVRAPWVRHAWAEAFVRWATGPSGQAQIAAFGRDRYGEPLFRPVAVHRPGGHRVAEPS